MKKFPKSRNMRTGKYVAQGSHASIGALLSIAEKHEDKLVIPLSDPFVKSWLTERFKKITVYVENDEELVEIYKSAIRANLPASLIRDAGLTEFNGEPTLTAVGIGPADPVEIDKITGNLPLF